MGLEYLLSGKSQEREKANFQLRQREVAAFECMAAVFKSEADNAERLRRIHFLLSTISNNMETLMSSFEDLKSAQDATDAKVAAVKADVEKLMGLLAAIPPAGMTPEQQAALDVAVVHAGAINASLSAVDAEVNPPAAPAPAPAA